MAAESAARAGGLVGTIRRHPLVSFFVIAYATSWILWIPVIGLPPFDAGRHTPALYILPGTMSVTATAFALTAITQGKPGVRRLLQRLVLWRVGPQWFAVAVLLIPVAGILVAVAFGVPDALGAFAPGALALYPAAYAAHFIFGPLFEESGWRGFALPRMQHRFGPVRGSLLLGLLWSGWHFFLYVPVWFASGNAADGLISLAVFVVMTTGMTFLFTWLFNNTRAGLLTAILMHGSVDGTSTYLQVLADKGLISPAAAELSIGIGMTIAIVVLLVILLVTTRGKLSYPRYRREAEALDLDPAETAEPIPTAGA
jgi:uncharacterized protein